MLEEEEREVTVAVHREKGILWAEVLDLPGCFASGRTPEELQLALEEAIGHYLSDDDRTAVVSLSVESALTPAPRKSVLRSAPAKRVPARLALA